MTNYEDNNMHPIFADYFTNATELKQNVEAVLEQAETATVAILDHNQPTAYLIPATVYEALLEHLEDSELATLIKARASEKSQAIEVSLNDL